MTASSPHPTAAEVCRCGLPRGTAVHGNPFGAGHTYDPRPAAPETTGDPTLPEVLIRLGEKYGSAESIARAAADLAGMTVSVPAPPAPFVLTLNGHAVGVVENPDLAERGMTSLTYDYQQKIELRAFGDLDGRVLLHEVLHALLRTDPQGVCPAHDPRHEDFVRMLTAGLHDAAGYRRAAQ